MPKARAARAKRSPLLLKVLVALGGVRVTESVIEDNSGRHVLGLAEGQHVWISPVYSTVSTLVHEVLHTMYPRWSEEYVLGRETYLMNRLTPAEAEEIYKIYLKKTAPHVRPRRRAKKA